MSSIDELMARCPLKHHIREQLWEVYVKRLGKDRIKYLTLYCPPLMDVKHFSKKGYIALEGNIYKDVVAVTNKKEGFGDTISQGMGRPQHLPIGLLHKLIEAKDKGLLENFPFDVINLDYCNFIVGSQDEQFLSNNLRDLVSVVTLQDKNDCGEFVLLITTRAEQGKSGGSGFGGDFIRDLYKRIELNIEANADYRREYRRVFLKEKPSGLVSKDYRAFIAVGIIKYVAMLLATKGYRVSDCDAFWLKRNEAEEGFEYDLLHLALLIKRGKPIKHGKSKYVSQVGATFYLERGAVVMIAKVGNGKVDAVDEKSHKQELEKKYGEYLKILREETFELKVPPPIAE